MMNMSAARNGSRPLSLKSEVDFYDNRFLMFVLDSTLAILSRQEGRMSRTIDELSQSSYYRRRTPHAAPARGNHTGLSALCATVFAPGLGPRTTLALRSH